MKRRVSRLEAGTAWLISAILLFGFLAGGCEDSDQAICPVVSQAEQVFFSFVENDIVRVASISSEGKDFGVIIEYGILWSSPLNDLLSYFSWDDASERGSIYVSNLDGSLIKRISGEDPSEAQSLFPVISPSKEEIAYFAYPHNLFLASINGDDRIQLADDAANELIAAFSPSGDRLTYYGTENRLILINRDGSGRQVLSNEAYCYNDGFARLEFSPDGEQIAYIGFDNGATDVCVTNIEGTQSVNLTRDSAEDCWPAWSPDGRYLAYSGGLDGDIWMVDFGDSSKHNLTQTTDSQECFSQWSPDGTRIIYIRLEPGGEGSGVLMMIDVQTKKKKMLFANSFTGFWKK